MLVIYPLHPFRKLSKNEFIIGSLKLLWTQRMARAVWNAIRGDPLEVEEQEDVEQLDAGHPPWLANHENWGSAS